MPREVRVRVRLDRRRGVRVDHRDRHAVPVVAAPDRVLDAVGALELGAGVAARRERPRSAGVIGQRDAADPEGRIRHRRVGRVLLVPVGRAGRRVAEAAGRRSRRLGLRQGLHERGALVDPEHAGDRPRERGRDRQLGRRRAQRLAADRVDVELRGEGRLDLGDGSFGRDVGVVRRDVVHRETLALQPGADGVDVGRRRGEPALVLPRRQVLAVRRAAWIADREGQRLRLGGVALLQVDAKADPVGAGGVTLQARRLGPRRNAAGERRPAARAGRRRRDEQREERRTRREAGDDLLQDLPLSDDRSSPGRPRCPLTRASPGAVPR